MKTKLKRNGNVVIKFDGDVNALDFFENKQDEFLKEINEKQQSGMPLESIIREINKRYHNHF